MATEFEKLFGYNPIEEWQQLNNFQKKGNLGASIAPHVDAQVGYMSQMETNRANMQIAQMQNDYNLEMWNKQNEYNSPSATMQRLVEAGINPRAYQQIGQFANASQPHKAEGYDYNSPLGHLAKFAEKAQIDMAIKSQRLERLRLSKDIALETADKIRAYRELDETKRHNVATEATANFRAYETERHNLAVEGIENVSLLMKDSEFRLALAKAGITRNEDGTFNIPPGDIRLEQKYKHQMLDRLEKAGIKLKTETDYLEQKRVLEQINTGVKWVDALAKLIGAIL